MNIYIYSDESGVFDRDHNDYYVYGGLLFLDKESRDIATRQYKAIENNITHKYEPGQELKATIVTPNHKRRLFGATKNTYRFGGIIDQKRANAGFYSHKKSKQRYLDYVYKLTLKNAFIHLHDSGILDFDDVEQLIIYTDEHTTATDGIYELREAIYQELHIGTTNFKYNSFIPPILKNLKNVDLKLCDSSKVTLVRAADIIANTIYRAATNGKDMPSNLILKRFP